MKILCSGGGTLGPVTPLLGLVDMLREFDQDVEVVWVGTSRGVERSFLPRIWKWYGVSEAKFRRYLSLSTFGDVWRFIFAFFQSVLILLKERPACCISAGGYVSVPVHLAAWILRIPTWVHQLDYRVGLANSIMSRFATCITTSLPVHLGTLPKKTQYGFGTWVRKELFTGEREAGQLLFGATSADMCVLVLGGGTGAQAINAAVCAALSELSTLHIHMIHLTGEGRGGSECVIQGFSYRWYKPHAFLGTDLRHVLARADIIVGRAGFATIAEAAALFKPLILIPKSGHQEDNVQYLEDRQAIKSIPETVLTAGSLVRELQKVCQNEIMRKQLGEILHNTVPAATAEKTVQVLQSCISQV